MVLMDVKGSDAGFFDEMGSVYVSDILRPLEPHEIHKRQATGNKQG
jgi:hypothetical protein